MPIPLLHLVLDPLTQRLVALKIAKDILACTHPITAAYDLPHELASLSATRESTVLASFPM